MTLEEQMTDVSAELLKLENDRESAFSQSRSIIRKTKTAIHLIHEGKRDPELIDSISSDLAALIASLSDDPQALFGSPVADAMMEFAETVIYDYAARGEEIPSYDILDVTPVAWVMGLADAVGELRRDMLRALMDGDLEKAMRLFSTMEELTDALMVLDVKDSVAPVRKKQDMARAIMDRSRADISTASVMSRYSRV